MAGRQSAEILRGPLPMDLLLVAGGFYAIGNIAGFFVGALLQPFFAVDPLAWGRWAAGYVGVFGLALVLLSRI